MFDELQLYCGDDIIINNKVVVTQPTLNQIKEFGETNYFNTVHTLCSVGADLKWQLWDNFGIDYTKIDDYELFLRLIFSALRPYMDEDKEKLINPMELILKDIDFSKFNVYTVTDTEQLILYNPEDDITIDRLAYSQIVDCVRKIHGLKRNNELPANERTKMDMIEDARDEAYAQKVRARASESSSVLRPLISALSVYTGQCGNNQIMDMKICMFLDNIKRVSHIQDSQMLLQGAYSGFASLKGVDTSRLDWSSPLQ